MSLDDGSASFSVTSYPLALGILAGVAACLLGYLLTGVVASADVERTFGESVPSWKAFGWYFYNAHFVDLTVEGSVSVGELGGSGTQNLVAGADDGLVQWLYLVPPMAIALGGAVLSRWFDGDADLVSGGARGALVVLGYLPIVVVGAFTTTHTVEGGFLFVEATGTATPQLVPAIVIAGVLYPIVFGELGGAVAAAIDSRR